MEHYPYQNGLLIWQWDTSQADNNVGQHPGEGLILPVDAHAKPLKWADGTLMRNRIQAYDSTFSRYPTDGITLHNADVEHARSSRSWASRSSTTTRATTTTRRTRPAGVKVTDTNTRIKIVKEPLDGSTMTLQVGPSGEVNGIIAGQRHDRPSPPGGRRPIVFRCVL